MTRSVTSDEDVPRTNICEECEREIVPELVELSGQHELIHEARKQDGGFMPITAGSATVTLSCRCSHVQAEYGPGSASAWDIPDGWMWKEEFPELFSEDVAPSPGTNGGEQA